MKLRKYTPEQLIEAAASSFSYRQALEKLNVVPAGGNYEVIKKAINYFNIDVSHFTGQASNRGRKFPRKSRPTQDYLDNKYPIQSYKLKLRLLNESILEHRCVSCGLKTWQDKPIPLELHHKDGDRSNNNLSNLELLCPNCHALTPSYRGKNISRRETRTLTPLRGTGFKPAV